MPLPGIMPEPTSDWEKLNLKGKVKTFKSVKRHFEECNDKITQTDTQIYKFTPLGRLAWYQRHEYDAQLTDFAAYEFDKQNRMVHSTDKTGAYSYTYAKDKDGNTVVTKKSDKFLGKKTKIVYDANGVLTDKNAANVTIVEKMFARSEFPLTRSTTYDESGRVIGSRATSGSVKIGNKEYEYDGHGNLLSIYDHDRGNYPLIVQYEYDKNGVMRKKTMRSYFLTFYREYDQRGFETFLQRWWDGDKSRAKPMLDYQIRTYNQFDTQGNLQSAKSIREDDGHERTTGRAGFDKNFKCANKVVASIQNEYIYY
ncbi:hypothetical protein [Kingella potus]|uniref:hypothetical protein n=1 Tax=Kingella potus TaxID=265175 RepID=UPI001FD4CF8F|nr:hypothetical protein [Kingella potus]UOP00838.1 hypothetical protein LVJ84_14045 [Kingella potus]